MNSPVSVTVKNTNDKGSIWCDSDISDQVSRRCRAAPRFGLCWKKCCKFQAPFPSFLAEIKFRADLANQECSTGLFLFARRQDHSTETTIKFWGSFLFFCARIKRLLKFRLYGVKHCRG